MIISFPSDSGASLFLGIIPGSLDDVKKRNVKSYKERGSERCMNLLERERQDTQKKKQFMLFYQDSEQKCTHQDKRVEQRIAFPDQKRHSYAESESGTSNHSCSQK